MHLKFFLNFLLTIILVGFCAPARCAFAPTDTIPARFAFFLNGESLRSTHTTFFNGFSLGATYSIFPKLSAGLGYEQTYCKYHPDNNSNLYRLHFNPVFTVQYFKVFSFRSLHLYTEIREGISFAHYKKEDFKINPGIIYPVSEKGFYGYGGVGISKSFLKKFEVLTQVGFKAFHISTNDQDVNPHGLNFQGGLKYYFP